MVENPWLKVADKLNDEPEIFETEKYGLFSCDENAVNKFDELIVNPNFENVCDNLQEYIEYLCDELELSTIRYQAIEVAKQKYFNEKLEYEMEKAEYLREVKRGN